MLAIAVVGQWEGLRLYAYKDVIGIWTACYGETHNIKPGMKFSKEQCDHMFMGSLRKHERGMRKCMAERSVNPDTVPMKSYVSFLSLTYNIGVGAYCRSTSLKRLARGDLAGACRAATWFNKAGGRKIKGLVNRRKDEFKLCIQGLREG